MRIIVMIIIAITAFVLPAPAAAQTATTICYNANPAGGWTGWECGPVLPVRVTAIGVEYVRQGETVSFASVAAGGDYVVVAPAGCLNVSMTAVQRQYATALRNPATVSIRRDAPFLTCPVEVYRILPDREWGQPRPAAEVIGEVSGALGTAASLSQALRDWMSNQLILWVVAILVGGWLAARVIGSIIDLVSGRGDEDDLIQAEAELYEHLEARGIDKKLADDIAGSWRDRLSDD